ncbi:MAG TPA: carbon monoxide dehydrogenase subunit G [Thermomicrobiales bacterium]|nr:carbon monoxide dehydrogenase subunit G [Thermomicrobiales bacterium]
MQITGEHTINAPREDVYNAMLDPEVLKGALPGCEKLEEVGPDEYIATMTMGVAMIKGKYDGKVRITDQDRPNGFTMHIEGKGPQGQIGGVGKLTFEDDGAGGTLVSYTGDANVRGMLARIGGRVIQPAAKMIVGKFFESLQANMAK